MYKMCRSATRVAITSMLATSLALTRIDSNSLACFLYSSTHGRKERERKRDRVRKRQKGREMEGERDRGRERQRDRGRETKGGREREMKKEKEKKGRKGEVHVECDAPPP